MKLYCAECGAGFEPDTDHVRLSVDVVRIDDADRKEAYAFHPQCWREVSEKWCEPA
jgi:hypothetical protein